MKANYHLFEDSGDECLAELDLFLKKKKDENASISTSEIPITYSKFSDMQSLDFRMLHVFM